MPLLKTKWEIQNFDIGKYIIQLECYFYSHVNGQRQTGLEKETSSTSPVTMVHMMHILFMFLQFL